MTGSDPLSTAPNANPVLKYMVNVLFEFDCFISAIFTGSRDKTISCWLGEDEEVRFGPIWYWTTIWLWWPVNFIGYTVFGQANHCESSVGPFITYEDAP